MKKKTLVGVDGNAFCIMGTVSGWMEEAYDLAKQRSDEDGMKAFNEEAVSAYTSDAMSSDYNHLLGVSVKMTDKINKYCCRK